MVDDPNKLFQQVMDAARREGRAEGRVEGFAEGFAAAMRMVQEFSASAKAPGPGTSRGRSAQSSPSQERPIPKGRVRLSDVPYAPRIAGDKADQLVEDAYQFIAPKAAGPAEIQYIIKQRGADLPGTSVRRAIERLTNRGRLRQISARTWEYLSPNQASGGDGGERESGRRNVSPNSAKAANGTAPAHA
jgi:hypothetical protein